MKTASWYHASLKPIARSAGRSVVAAAAYRTGSRMEDERYASVRDYSRKSDVVTSFTLARDGAPSWALDAEQLWNAVEEKENRKNSQLAFEFEVALPNELDNAQREVIARNFSQWLVDEYGVAVTTGIHEGGDRGNGKNDHAHVMMTTREIGPDGWAKNKLRDFNSRPGQANPEVEHVRNQIADFINDALEDAGSDERVDPRSFAARGIDTVPTKHLGPAGTAIERRDADGSDRADINRQIMEERLAWQYEQSAPEITPAIEQELSQRWEGWQPLQRGEATETAEWPAVEHGSPIAAADDEHRGWRHFVDRIRSFQARAAEFLHDETSGPHESDLGFAARVMGTGLKLISGWHHKNAYELQEGLEEANDLAGETEAKKNGDPSQDDWQPHKSFAERLRDQAVAFLYNERGSVPDADFDQKVAEWTQGPMPDEGPPLPASPEPETLEPEGPDIE